MTAAGRRWLSAHSGALYSGAVALVGGLSLVVVGNETFADITLAEWLIVAGAVLAAGKAGSSAQAKVPPPVDEPGSTERGTRIG